MQIVGTGNSDLLSGTAADDVINGLAGNDMIDAGSGNDTVDGGEGADTIRFADPLPASNGVVADLDAGRVWNGAETDVLVSVENVRGTSGGDWIRGDAASNVLWGQGGDDVLVAVGTGDLLDGGAGADALYGAEGNDSLSGGEGQDWLEAGAGDDVLVEHTYVTGEWSAMHGGDGNDTFIISGAGSNGAWGGEGNDTITLAGSGPVYAHGGSGADTLVIDNAALTNGGGGFMQVFDYELGTDRILVDVFNPAGAEVSVLDWGPNTGILALDIETGASAVIMLMGVTAGEINTARDLLLL